MSNTLATGQEAVDTDSYKSTTYFALHNSKDRLLEQKRAEHEQARHEHRRRFEEQMHLLETKQQRDESMLTGVREEAHHSLRTMPVTPIKTPAHGEARSRANTSTRTSPPLKVFENRHANNDQLVTPPSDHQVRSTSAYNTMRSTPGSRRTSTSLGFENLTLLESFVVKTESRNTADTRRNDHRRTSFNEQGRNIVPSEQQRLSLPKSFHSEEGPTTSYLQMNTTDDSFPILVRRDSYAPAPVSSFAELTGEQRKSAHDNSLSGVLTGQPNNRPSTSNPQPLRGMLEDLEVARTRPLPEFTLPSGQKVISNKGPYSALPDDISRRSFPAVASPGFRTGHSNNLNLSAMASPLQSPGIFAPYGLMHHSGHVNNYAPYLNYSNHHDMQRSPYVTTARNTNYNKRSTEDINRYADVALESLVGDIYSLCKDQHGCRFLQKKLDERSPTSVDLIFEETYIHAAELMIDPFGNYLCQKLLEHCDDDRRLRIVQTVSGDLVNISLNMHGTRAVQKLIEFLTTTEQIRITTAALNTNAVTLIKDLNGNHVIQKCLNRLGSAESQFIFDAVSRHCVEVATHRHGCCVLQRCIDHASDQQKVQVIAEINNNAQLLVQDPFGNYVIQYVLDLGDTKFSDALIRRFVGNVCLFSVQKFSSNVIEKCLRVAEPATRALLIDELLYKARLEKLLRDSFANYVIQTALDYAEAGQREQLIECIRPLLPAIRTTPYGRRIQSKITGNMTNSNVPGNFNYTTQMAGFPGYGLRMAPNGLNSQNYSNSIIS